MEKTSRTLTFNALKQHSQSAVLLSFAVFCFVFSSVFLTQSAVSQTRDVENRLNRIENEIQTLSEALFRGTVSPDAAAALSSGTQARANSELRLSQLEMDLRNLNGQLEQLDYRLRQVEDNLSMLVNNLDLRVSDLETRLLGQSAGTPPQQTGRFQNDLKRQQAGRNNSTLTDTSSLDQGTVQRAPLSQSVIERNGREPFQTGTLGTLSVPSDRVGQINNFPQDHLQGLQNDTTNQQQYSQGQPGLNLASLAPTELYDRAFSFLRNRDYDQAQRAFQMFLDKNPDHNLAANAQYWLGETFYVTNDFERSARIFAEGYKKYPDGTKGPDNLLKLGMSLSGLGKTQDACLTFNQISIQYPNAPSAILTRARQESEKLTCPNN